MKIYTCTTFTGHFPVGTAAVVVADNTTLAADLLNCALQQQGLPGDALPADMEEVNLAYPHTMILCNGDY